MIPAMDRPSEVFSKLFLRGKPEVIAREKQKLSDGRSILDSLSEQRNRLLRKASPTDRQRLDAPIGAGLRPDRALTLANSVVGRTAWLGHGVTRAGRRAGDRHRGHDAAGTAGGRAG